MPDQFTRRVNRRVRGAIAAAFLLLAATSVHAATIAIAWDPNPEPTVKGYVVYVGTSPSTVSETHDVGLSTEFTQSNAIAGTTYWISVAAYTDASHIGPTSTIVVTAASVPPAPVALGPSGSVTTSTPTFSWKAVGAASAYSLWVNDSASTGKVQQTYAPAGIGCGSGGTCTVTSPVPLAAGSADWSVRASNSAGDGPWSGAMSFSVPVTSSGGSATGLTLIPRSGWKLRYVDSQETVGANNVAVNAFDASAATMWHSRWYNGADPLPHEIQIDLGAAYAISGFRYLPRQDGSHNGWIGRYEFYVSTDGVTWGTPVATGTLANDATEKQVTFASKTGRYVRLRALSEVNGLPYTSMADFNVLGTAASTSTTATTIPQLHWHLKYVDSQETVGQNNAAVNAFDGNAGTMWHSVWYGGTAPLPHEIQIDLGATYAVSGFRYLPRQDGWPNGRIGQYEFYVSADGTTWGSPVATGTLANDAKEKQVTFPAKRGRYVRLRALTEVDGRQYTSMAELNVIGLPE
jgi:hypothetical protein